MERTMTVFFMNIWKIKHDIYDDVQLTLMVLHTAVGSLGYDFDMC